MTVVLKPLKSAAAASIHLASNYVLPLMVLACVNGAVPVMPSVSVDLA